MRRQYWVWAIAPVAIVTVLCANGWAQSVELAARHEGHRGSVGYHYQNPAQYRHVGRAYSGSDYVGRPGVYYRQGHVNTNYYRSYGYAGGYGVQGGYSSGYGSSYYTRPTWYEGLTRRDNTTGQTTTWSPLQYNTAGYYVGNYASGSYAGSAAGYTSGYGCGYTNCGGCNVCGSYVQPQPTVQWRTMSTDKAQRDAWYRNQQPTADPCEPCDPCRKGVQHEHKPKRNDARRDDRSDRNDAQRDQRRRRLQQQRERDNRDRGDRDDRPQRPPHHRRPQEPRGESRQPIERKQIEIGYPSGGNEWMELGPQLISDEQPRGEVNLQRREIVDTADGWQMMREGDVEAAREWFSQQVMSESKNASLQIGYALSSAATGKMATGVWAMRQALRLDRAVLGHIRMDQQLAGQVRDLIGRYRYAPSDLISDSDGAYMAAALHYLLGEFEYAAVAIDQALDNGGDDDRSVLQLRDVIDGAQRRR